VAILKTPVVVVFLTRPVARDPRNWAPERPESDVPWTMYFDEDGAAPKEVRVWSPVLVPEDEPEKFAAAMLPETVSDVRVPTDVSDELTTVEFRVVPVRVPAGAITALPDAAVIKPLALTVKVGIDVEEPKDPTLALTVAKVVAKEPAEVVISPVRAGNLPAASVPVALVLERSTG